MSDDKRRRRLKFRSWHRGTREMDLLLGSFADAHVDRLTPDELTQYEAIMEQGDPDLYNWITGAENVPKKCDNRVMRMLLAHRYKQ
ncbi:MAG: succinate dehydrogenase assembly factor 2 [Bdellovibrionales bacterium]